MEILFNSSTRSMAFTFVALNVGFTIGAWLCGMIFDRTNREFCFMIAVIVEATATICAAFMPNFYSFAAFISLQGCAMGFINTGGLYMYLCTVLAKNSSLIWEVQVISNDYNLIHFSNWK